MSRRQTLIALKNVTARIRDKPILPATSWKIETGRELICLRDTTATYGDQVVLDRLNWTFSEGENWAVRGPNGSGKSTLVKLITGDHPQAYANHIRLFGRRRGSGESIWEIKKHIGLISSELQIRYRQRYSGH